MTTLTYSDDHIRHILTTVRTIALVGASDNKERPSHEVMEFLIHKGYRIIPVNPRLAGQSILGETVYADLKSIPEAIDMVELFLNPTLVDAPVDEAIAIGAKVVWMQIGVVNESAADKAEAAGLTVIMNRCPKREIPRLGL